jgi:hypothetical protein
MNKVIILVLSLFFVASIISVTGSSILAETSLSREATQVSIGAATKNMANYLVAGFDSNLGLIRESPNANPNLYWIYSDNYLASLALKSKQSKLSKNLAQSIAVYNDIIDFTRSPKWYVLSGQTIPEAVIVMQTLNQAERLIQGKRMICEGANPTAEPNILKNYADLLLLASINAKNDGETAKARNLFSQVRDMYDGVGFNDAAYQKQGYYATYKLALYLIAAKKVGINTYTNDIKKRILSLQENVPSSNGYGGIYTDYDSSGKISDSDTNTETTSLALMALN